MSINIRTFSPTKRYYLLEAEPCANETILSKKDVNDAIRKNLLKLFGSAEIDKIPIEVFERETNRFVVSTDASKSIALRSCLLLSPSNSRIHNFRVISEASFLQSILHNSRLYFSPLL